MSSQSQKNQIQACLLLCGLGLGVVALLMVLFFVTGVVAELQKSTGIDQAVETVKATPGPGGGIFAFVMNPLVLGLGIVALGVAWILGKFKL